MSIRKHEPGFPALFISAEVAGASIQENTLNTELMAAYLMREEVTFDRCIGSYHGREEFSFRVCLPNADVDPEEGMRLFEVVRRLMTGFDQESFMAVRPDGKVTMFYRDQSRQHLGQWHSCHRDDVADGEDYTCISGEYFKVIS